MVLAQGRKSVGHKAADALSPYMLQQTSCWMRSVTTTSFVVLSVWYSLYARHDECVVCWTCRLFPGPPQLSSAGEVAGARSVTFFYRHQSLVSPCLDHASDCYLAVGAAALPLARSFPPNEYFYLQIMFHGSDITFICVPHRRSISPPSVRMIDIYIGI